MISLLSQHKTKKWKRRLDAFKRWRNKQYQLEKQGKGYYLESRLKQSLFTYFTQFSNIKGAVLDLGCGGGHIRNFLGDGYRYFGIDPIIIDFNDERIIQGIAENLPFKSELFDFVISYSSLDHMIDMDQTFGEAYRVLKNNGFFVIEIGCHDKFLSVLNDRICEISFIRYLKAMNILHQKIIRHLFGMETHTHHFTIYHLLHLYRNHGFSALEIQLNPMNENSIFMKGMKSSKEYVHPRKVEPPNRWRRESLRILFNNHRADCKARRHSFVPGLTS